MTTFQGIEEELAALEIVTRRLPPDWTMAGHFQVGYKESYYPVSGPASEIVPIIRKVVSTAAQEPREDDRSVLGTMFGREYDTMKVTTAQGLEIDLGFEEGFPTICGVWVGSMKDAQELAVMMAVLSRLGLSSDGANGETS